MKIPLSPTVKNFFGASFIYTFGEFVSKGIGFILIPIYTRFLEPADYGVLSVVMSINGIFVIVFDLGLSGAIARFYFDYTGEKELSRKEFFFTLYLFKILYIFLLSFLLFYLAPFLEKILLRESAKEGIYFKYLSLFLFASSSAPLYPLLFRIKEKPIPFIIFQTFAFTLTSLLIIYFVVHLKEGALGSIKGRFYSAVFIAFISVVLSLKELKIGFLKEKLKESIKFGIPIMPHLFSHWITSFSDRIILTIFVPLNSIGIYSLGNRLGMMLEFIVSAFNSARVPIYFRLLTEKKETEFYSLMNSFLYINFFLFIFFLAFSKEIVFVLGTKDYYGAFYIMPFFVLAAFIKGIYYNSVSAIFYIKKTKLLPLSTGISAITSIFLNLILIPNFGIYGASLSFVLSYFVLFASTHYFAQKAFPLKYPWKKLIKNLFPLLISGALSLSLSFFIEDLLNALFLKIIFLSIGFFIYIRKGGFLR